MGNSLGKEIVRQSQDIQPDNFICNECKNYHGALSCEKGIFIAFEGANLSGCPYFSPGRKCRYCGKVT